jgi:hypothetical protein
MGLWAATTIVASAAEVYRGSVAPPPTVKIFDSEWLRKATPQPAN